MGPIIDPDLTNQSTLTPFPTSIEAARANILANSKFMVSFKNADIKSRYLSLFNDWLIGRHAHPDLYPLSGAPKPPNGVELAPPDSDGFVWYQDSNTAVCAMPAIPEEFLLDSGADDPTKHPDLPPNVTDIGSVREGIGFNSGPSDTNPVGKIVTLPDGRKVQKVRYGPFGFFYEFVS